MEKGLMLCDAHTHVGTEEEQREREEMGILSLVCASAPREAEWIFLHRGKYVIPTCGVHPWYVQKWGLDCMEKWVEQCTVIGEIGMDSVWCGVPLKLQEDVFCRQLEMACDQKKPVILHTKGQEEKIARIIKEYPNRYLVHWYSCEDYLKEYISLDCYFSIGPDVWWNQAVRDVARRVPRDRILIETDGLEAVKWAYEEGRKAGSVKTKEGPKAVRTPGQSLAAELKAKESGSDTAGWGIREALTATAKTTAEILGIRPEAAGRTFMENLVGGFLGIEDRKSFGMAENRTFNGELK